MNEKAAVSSTVTNTGPKKRTPANPRSRATPKVTAASRAAAKNKALAQFPSQDESQPQQTVNDPSRYAMVNQAQAQQQQMNKVSFNKQFGQVKCKIWGVN